MEKVLEPRMGVQGVESGIYFEPEDRSFSSVKCVVEPFESQFVLADGGIDARDLRTKWVAALNELLELRCDVETSFAISGHRVQMSHGGDHIPITGHQLFRFFPSLFLNFF